MPASSIPPVETRLHSYRIVKMKPKSSDRADPDFDLKGASAPLGLVSITVPSTKTYNSTPLNPPDLTVPTGGSQSNLKSVN
jgi:hypothetical protein